MKTKKIFLTILGAFLLYLASAGISYATFRLLRPTGDAGPLSPMEFSAGRSEIDLSAPKTEACPLNGALFTKDERRFWEARRPLTVMIENHQESRPQSGLTAADVVYEAVAEGGITRFLAVYYCAAAVEEITIGPVRSARVYFIDFASEYGDYPLYAHVGGANRAGPADALGQIEQLGWLNHGNDLNQFALGFPVFWRDYERLGHPVATEHTMYSTTDKLWTVAHERQLDAKDANGNRWDDDFVSWQFKDDGSQGEVDEIKVSFWRGYHDYDVIWQYDREAKLYRRFNGGQPHRDLNNHEQIQVKNVVAMFAKEKSLNDEEKHLLYTTTGKGKALVFQDGRVIKGFWQKADRQSRTKFLASSGQEIEFNRGPIWIEIIPATQEVEY